MQELNTNLQGASKTDIMNWLQLFFGTRQNSAGFFNQYPIYSYYLKLTDRDQISQEIDKVRYFGAIPRQLFNPRKLSKQQQEAGNETEAQLA